VNQAGPGPTARSPGDPSLPLMLQCKTRRHCCECAGGKAIATKEPPMSLTQRIAPMMMAAAAAFAAPQAASAQEAYPEKPIRLVVPWAPGGATDVIGRLVGQRLSDRLGQPVVIENKAGAGGNIGTASFVREKPDGYTLLMTTSSTHGINSHLYSRP